MHIIKEIRCPECNAQLDYTNIVLCSLPPYYGVKCSSNRCDWVGHIHGDTLVDDQYKIIKCQSNG